MTKRSRENEPGKLHEDANEIAFRTVQAAIGEAEKPIPPSERTEEPLRRRGALLIQWYH